jgi:signal transduction histidine kinase
MTHATMTELQAELERERRRTAELEATVRDLTRSVQELEAFAREISHDLKAPLVGICGYAQLLENMDFGVPRTPEFDEFVAEITRGTETMSQMIDDVLAYSTARGAQMRPTGVDLTALVQDVAHDWGTDLRRVADGPRAQITWDALPAVQGDHLMLRRVVDNLLGNAVKYVHPGETPRIHISAAAAEPGFVRIEVTDAGIGIPEGQHEAVFSELHRAHAHAYPGTGLGLTICRRIMHRLGGEIGADPHYRDGARIWFTVPAAGS